MNDVVAVIEAPAEDITLDLDSEELHYLCQETNRPTLGVNWDYLAFFIHILIVVLYRTLFIVIKRCLVCVHIVREFY